MSEPPLSMEKPDFNLQEEETIRGVPQGKGETILFVEDNDLMREVGMQILEDLGYQVLCASNGLEALKVFNQSEDIDLIFTDVVMPEVGGAAMLQKIRQSGSQVKALAVTGHILAEDLDQLKEAGVKTIIHKPYDVDILAVAVRQALDEE